MKVYAKVRPNKDFTLFHSPNISHAVLGFREMGFEIITYNLIEEIYDKVTADDIVLDYISQVDTVLNKFGAEARCEDYPEVLTEFLGRSIWKDTINHINTTPELWGIFVKPVKHKVFTGKVINSTKDLIGCGSCYENYEVYCSEILDIKREWRGFVYYDELIDIRPYCGDYHYNYNPEVVDKVIEAFKTWKDRPVACSIDFAVVERKGKVAEQTENGLVPIDKEYAYYDTIVLEVNDAYALGNYGLRCLDYAKMISARWSQLLCREDECRF